MDRTLTKVHVTSSHDSTSFQLLIKIVNALRAAHEQDRLTPTGHSYDGVKNELLVELDRLEGVLCIVVDEADDIRDPDKLFKDLSRLTERNELSGLDIAIIALVNDGSFLEELEPATQSALQPKQISFPPYKQSEIQAILEKRSEAAFQEGAMPQELIPLCTSHCLRMGGDIRDGIELLKQAGETARVRIRNDSADSEPEQITEDDVEQAATEITPVWFEQAVQKLSTTGLQALFAVATKTALGKAPARTAELYDTNAGTFEPLVEKRQFREHLRSLSERGLLCKINNNNGRKDSNAGQYYEYELGIDLADTIEVLSTVKFANESTTELLTEICDEAVANNVLTSSRKDRILSTEL